ncbi:MAG: transposase [Nostoc sp.]|uniref:transposase n=1 Tax=Nostoc sp. TaxID=1180 RepID=UPI002FF50551
MLNKSMYEYRKLTAEQKAELVKYRLSQGYPPHSPPHEVRDKQFYLLTVACYEHQCHIHTESRRQQLLDMIFHRFGGSVNEERSAEALTTNLRICAWVVLPNHYHLLVDVENFDVLGELFRRIHGLIKSPYDWVESSVHLYLQACGRQWLRDCWTQYPV